MPKQCLFVLGMHRSGTSLATRLFSIAGAIVPGTVLPANPDNPTGYWEPKELVDLDNSLMKAAGRPWHDHRSFPGAVYADPAALDRIGGYLRATMETADLVVLKDPRLCRLFPLWAQAAADLEIEVLVTMMIRDPLCVADSLNRRNSSEAFRNAAMLDPARIDLLWLRYTLEAEHFSRGHNRIAFDHEDVARTPADVIASSIDALGVNISMPLSHETKQAAIDFVNPKSARTREPGFARDQLPLSSAVYDQLRSRRHEINDAGLQRYLDEIRETLDDVSPRFGELDKQPVAARTHMPVARSIVVRTRQKLIADQPLAIKHVTFISGAPSGIAHRYRVDNRVSSLRRAGIEADSISIDDLPTSSVPRRTDVVVAFRCASNEALRAVLADCDSRGIPWGVDFDDLIFSPRLMNAETVHFLAHLPSDKVLEWQAKSEKYAALVRDAGFAWASTRPLASAFRSLGVAATLVPNGIGPERLAAASAVKRDRKDDLVRIGYACGSNTHQADFAVLVPAIADLLHAHANLRLSILGYIDIGAYKALEPYRSQIERRKRVPFEKLSEALASFDINVAPLVRGNPFCEAKSELKFIEAALVNVPTVATATTPFCDAIDDGQTGLLVRECSQWYEALLRLVTAPGERARLGSNARTAALAMYGPEPQTEDVLAALHALAG